MPELQTLLTLQNWILTIFLGIIASLIANYLPDIMSAFKSASYGRKLFRTWEHYYFNFDYLSLNHAEFHHESLRIYRRFWLLPRVDARHTDNNARYHGRVLFRKGFLSFEMKSREFQERVYEYFSLPNFDSTAHKVMICGLALAEDFNGRPAVAAVLLSTIPLDEKEVIATIKKRYLQNKTKALIVLT